MSLYIVVHHPSSPQQTWANAWLSQTLLSAITTPKSVAARLAEAKAAGEAVFIHRCGWSSFPPEVCCLASVADIHPLDKATAYITFTDVRPVGVPPHVVPNIGQNLYESDPVAVSLAVRNPDTQRIPAAFEFEAFAAEIYRVQRDCHRRPFLLPAVYGGQWRQPCEVMFVFEAPSIRFTEENWRECTTVEAAVRMHRNIFHRWAYSGKQAHLFSALDGEGPYDPRKIRNLSLEDFFQRFYITDIWKDANFKVRKDREYQHYWLSCLERELHGVPAKRVIFVGKEAAKARPLVPASMRSHGIAFPSQWLSYEEVTQHVRALLAEIERSS